MNPLILLFLICFINIFILIGKHNFKIVKTTISSDKITDEQISELYTKKPAIAWKMHLFKSLQSFQQDFINTVEWWKDNGYTLVNQADYNIVYTLIKSTDITLDKVAKKLKILKRPLVHIILLFKDPNDLTKKIFGKDIFDICLRLNLLKTIKEQLSSKPYFKTLLDKESMSEMLAISIMSPNEENQSFLTEVLKPIITKELVIKEIERTSMSLNIDIPVKFSLV